VPHPSRKAREGWETTEARGTVSSPLENALSPSKRIDPGDHRYPILVSDLG
jgi:hypothetical protein